jgi:zinc protease
VNPDVPVVAVRAAFLGGTLHEPENRAGQSHMMAEALVKGTRSRSVFDVAHGIDAVGGQIDGFSGRNSFGVKAEFLSKYLEDGLDLFAEVLCHPSFPDEEVQKLRDDTQAAMRLRKDHPAAYAFRLFEETMYPAHPFGRDVLGRPETVERTSAEDLQSLFEAGACPERLAVAVAGDVDPDLVHEFFLLALEHLDGTGSLPAAPPPPTPPDGPRIRRVDAPIEQAHVVVGFLGTQIQSPDRFPLRVVNGMLAGQGGRLFRKLRDELGLAYAVTSACVEGLAPGYLAGYIATAPDNAERSRQGLLDEFARLAGDALGADEVEQAQRKLAGGFEIALQENGFQAAQMALDELYGLGYRTFEAYARSLLEVTPAEVAAAARRYLRPDSYAALTLGP